MDTFKVGEVAVTQNSETGTLSNGSEVLIIGGLNNYQLVKHGDIVVFGYEVQSSDGAFWLAKPNQLRKIRPPATGLESILALFKPMPQREGVAA
jgi:hypothetical protein